MNIRNLKPGLLALTLGGSHAVLTPPPPGPPPSSYLPVVAAESLPALRDRLTATKAQVLLGHLRLLQERYDLTDRPLRGVTMSGGKAIQGGVRARLPRGRTWEELAALREQDLWPGAFYPLPHPQHGAGGMVFPHAVIEELKAKEARDLTRFDLALDLPDPFLTASWPWPRAPSRPSPCGASRTPRLTSTTGAS
jgi:cytochrome c peroxidase